MNKFEYKIQLIALVCVLCLMPVRGSATCTSSVFNTGASTDISIVTDNSCVTNSGTILTNYISIWIFSKNNTILNSGTISHSAPGVEGGGIYLDSSNNTSAAIENSGSIISSTPGTNYFYALWIINDAGTIREMKNSGSIFIANSSQAAGVAIYSGNTVQNLINTGNITINSPGLAGLWINEGASAANIVNSGTIAVTGNIHGILNNGFSSSNPSSIGALTNTGVITATGSNVAGYAAITNAAYGTITTLNNYQGATHAPSALTYTGPLPTQYNVIVRGGNYGQLAATAVTGATTFGVYSGGVDGVAASRLVKGTYSQVLTGLAPGNLNNTSGRYNGFTWTLTNSSGTTWDMVVTGASTADTQASVQNSAAALRTLHDLHSAVLANSLAHDCVVFNQNNLCVSAGGQYTTVESNRATSTSALLVAAYRPKPNYRIGLSLDQSVSGNRVGPTLSLNPKMPLVTLFGHWSESQDGTGKEVKIAAAYGQKNTTVNRQIVGDSEAGSGSSRLDSQGVQVTIKYGFSVSEKVLLRPYAGLRYSRMDMGGYTEAATSAVTAPLTFAKLSVNATTVLAGLEGHYRLSPETTLFAAVGAEHQSRANGGRYSATGIDGLSAVALNPNPVKTRAAATVGGYHDLSRHQRPGFLATYRQEPSRSVSSTSAMLTYSVGL